MIAMNGSASSRPSASRPGASIDIGVVEADQRVSLPVLGQRGLERLQFDRASRPSPSLDSAYQVSSSTIAQWPTIRVPPTWNGG